MSKAIWISFIETLKIYIIWIYLTIMHGAYFCLKFKYKIESVRHSVVSDCLWPPWTVACQAPLSMGFYRQEYWSGLLFSSPGNLSDPGIKSGSPALQADSLLSEQSYIYTYIYTQLYIYIYIHAYIYIHTCVYT